MEFLNFNKIKEDEKNISPIEGIETEEVEKIEEAASILNKISDLKKEITSINKTLEIKLEDMDFNVTDFSNYQEITNLRDELDNLIRLYKELESKEKEIREQDRITLSN